MEKLNEDLKNNKLQRIYLLYGEQTYLIRQYREKIRHALGMDEDTMNFSAFEGKDINEKEIVDLAETLPFFAERRLILIENSGWFKETKEDAILADYLSGAPESTYFLFVEEAVNRRSKMFRAVSQTGSAVEFTTPDKRTLKKWIGGRLRSEGKSMTEEAYQDFISKTGTDMENMDREMEKLICYCLDKEIIEKPDVEEVTTEQPDNKVFAMVDAIAMHEPKKALDLYYDLLALKEPPLKILSLIMRQFQILAVVKAMSNQGFGDRDIAAAAGCPDWTVQKNRSQCRNFSLEQLKQALADGISYEEAAKSGHMKDQLAVELLIASYSKKS